MAKKATKKRAAKKSKAHRAGKSAKSAAKAKIARSVKTLAKDSSLRKASAKPAPKPAAAPAPSASGSKLTFNHAMIYVKDVNRALAFYRDLLGFRLIEDFRFDGIPVYARLRAPGGDGTIALHQASASASLVSEGVRLYFEVPDLDGFCRKLIQKRFYITQMPRMMEWGWRHAYLNDPDGHEISLYWAGEKRWKKSVMQAAKAVAKG
jgi:catechol 2,3-dioxygenase-like lactoylglutathione lyase family enzyme